MPQLRSKRVYLPPEAEDGCRVLVDRLWPPDGHVGRAANQVNQSGHTDETAANAQNACEHAGEKADQNGHPRRAGDAGGLEVHHRRNLHLVQGLVPLDAGGASVKLFALGSGCGFLSLAFGHTQ